jgi:hypothetical protein
MKTISEVIFSGYRCRAANDNSKSVPKRRSCHDGNYAMKKLELIRIRKGLA